MFTFNFFNGKTDILIPTLTIGELCDKFTIVCLKSNHADNNVSLKEEKDKLAGAIKSFVNENMLDLLNKLYIENSIIWNLESQVMDTNQEFEINKVGKLAIEIRKHNTERVKLKNKLNELFNDTIEYKLNYFGFEEIK
jgi:hypothetical protein